MKKVFFSFLMLFALYVQAQNISLLPMPAEMSVNEGKFNLEKNIHYIRNL